MKDKKENLQILCNVRVHMPERVEENEQREVKMREVAQ
jgi:hypothetical protein